MASLIGQSLGRYHVLEQLGEGGMATVYKAYDTRLERYVAIKVILPGKEHSERFLKRFEREARALAQLSHPNIVGVIDYGDQDGMPYLVMEYLPGGNLKHKLSGKAAPWSQAARMLIPVARALAYAHSQKIIHRDVKPSNILITQSGEPMLSDFGIAKMLEAEETLDLTGIGMGVGTPEYMSPEQAQGKPVEGRSDLYSLGVVFYEMVAGRRPYQADTPLAIGIKQATEPLPRPALFAKDLPDSVERFLLKALAKRPEDRFPDMAAFASSLEGLLQGSRPPRVPRPRVHLNTRVALPVLAALVVLVALGVGFEALRSRLSFAGSGRSLLPLAPNLAVAGTPTPSMSARDYSTALAQTRVQAFHMTATLASQNATLRPAIGTATAKARLVFTATPLPKVTPPSPSTASNPPSAPAFKDTFDDPAYDGRYNASLWAVDYGTFPKPLQSNGYLSFIQSGVVSSSQEFAFRPRTVDPIALSQFKFIQSDLAVAGDANSGYSHVAVNLVTDNPSKGELWIEADLQNSSAHPSLLCLVHYMSKSNTTEYQHIADVGLHYGQFYTVRIQLDPATAVIKWFIDNAQVCSTTSTQYRDNLTLPTTFILNSFRDKGSYATTFADNVMIGK